MSLFRDDGIVARTRQPGAADRGLPHPRQAVPGGAR
ncbi:hypothetical protein J2X68_000431 [Streptomyces sp. 3330]|nr:hypothetical protein [Streptomyces sp. 3330]